MFFRPTDDPTLVVDQTYVDPDLEWIKEDSEGKLTRDLTDAGFFERYKHEAKMIASLFNAKIIKNILELGSGPGLLAQNIMELQEIEKYTLVDGEGARKVWELRGYKGDFHVQNLLKGFDVSNFEVGTEYDLVILDDFLEHIQNPSDVLLNCYELMSKGAYIFISVPNWRMGHYFIYPGLFDYDNFMKFLHYHKFEPKMHLRGQMQTPEYPRLQCEENLAEAALNDWNWYIVAEKRNVN